MNTKESMFSVALGALADDDYAVFSSLYHRYNRKYSSVGGEFLPDFDSWLGNRIEVALNTAGTQPQEA